MNCCGAGLAAESTNNSKDIALWQRDEELRRSGRVMPDGSAEYVFSVPDIHCGACISAIEDGLSNVEGIVASRVNLTLRRATVRLDSPERAPGFIFDALRNLGYQAMPLDIADQAHEQAKQSSELLKALAVAGFAAGNIMLLSVSVWSGAEGATRDLFHLVSAMIALPTVAYCGRPFFRSAFAALKVRRLNMDVPISLGVLLAVALSIYETFTGGAEAYFDAAVTLIFFLLIGRYLDQLMRERARSSVLGLARLAAKGAMVVSDSGEIRYMAVDEIVPGMRLRVPAGERMPVDAKILTGATELDRSLVTGESVPVLAGVGDHVEAGTLNLTGSVDLIVVRPANQSFLAEVLRMLEAAEQAKGRYERIADRMARAYAPSVHILSASAFVMWILLTGDFHFSLYTAIAVLIVTCPCALGLAVPVVHVIGAGRLFQGGILMRDGSALERLAEANHAVFDKTGTLTTGNAQACLPQFSATEARIARALALNSTHPSSRAVAEALSGTVPCEGEAIIEIAGFGMEGVFEGKRARLGRASFVAEISGTTPSGEGLTFAIEGSAPLGIAIAETPRDGAAEAIAALQAAGIECEILSGDAPASVARIAKAVGITKWRASETPATKMARLEELRDQGAKALMVGDGLNDAPALAAGHVSFAPASASDAGRFAADFIFTRDNLGAIVEAREISLKAARLVRQNFALAIAYNFISVPLAFAGQVTPLIAAIAMSTSSIIVLANSLRLQWQAHGNSSQKQHTRASVSSSRTMGARA